MVSLGARKGDERGPRPILSIHSWFHPRTELSPVDRMTWDNLLPLYPLLSG